MGVYTTGSLSGTFSRELTLGEYQKLTVDFEAGPPPCETPEGRYHWGHFETNNWEVNNDHWGDVGKLNVTTTTFEFATDGKVYDLEHAVAWFLQCLPPDVTVDPCEGVFDSDGEAWGIRIQGRECRSVSAWIELDTWDKGTNPLDSHKPENLIQWAQEANNAS